MCDIRYRLRVHKTIEPTILYFGRALPNQAALRRNLLDFNGTDSPFLILQGTLWPAYWTLIRPHSGQVVR